ncbi:hypothetical protein BDW02DRAFT_140625 [Decorospora gaudefroyi]|uniref:Cenp-s complex centromere protein x protein n=1 Tax=Decorospora gaudefroyi TaxID=184978 RepID=A0A6A5KND0_9PLEO|nr:hypothetical protein BDW02DRAFT_140625 [Decorospora gaudefroyi]
MPPKNATQNAARRKGPSFNPPRPINAPSQASTTTKRAATKPTAPASKSGFHPAADVIDLSEDEQDEHLAQGLDSDDFDDIMEDAPAPAPAPTRNPPPNPTLSEPVIPRPLLARLLLENFDDQNMQIQTGAMKLVGKYIDIFVTEAFLRAKDESQTAAREGGITDGFLQVEDLEKLAPQLVLDF